MKRNGYRPSYKNRWLLISEKVLTLQQWMLYEYLLDSMDWDPRHENFGLFEFFPDEITSIFDRSPESIADWFKCLVNKRFVRLHDKKRKLYGMKNPERYAFGRASKYELSERNITVEKLLQNICFSESDGKITGKIQEKIPQIVTPQVWGDPSKALSSFKDGLSIETRQAVRTIGDYKEIYQSEGYSLLLPEDMMWIDETQQFEAKKQLGGSRVIDDQDIADVFFGGDRRKYSAHLQINSV